MISALDLCALAAAAYTDTPTCQAGDVCVVITYRDGINYVAFKGTDPRCIRDVLRDLSFWPRKHKWIGYCHSGFLSGVEAVERDIRKALRPGPVIITGHSLGGAMALIFGALMVARGQAPFAVVTFGAPRAGFFKLARVLRKVADVRLYRNGNDPVPMVPWWLPWWPYMHPRALTPIGKPMRDPVEAHFISAYAASLREMAATSRPYTSDTKSSIHA